MSGTRKNAGGSGGAPTLSDVARRAGVSLATVSTVLNNPRSNTRVSEATRQRIIEVAAEMRYYPNAHARSLQGLKTGTLGVLFGLERATVAVANPYAFTVFQGIIAGAAEAGYNVTLFTEPWHDAARSAARLRDRRTDGIIVIAPSTDSDIISSLAELGIDLVSVSTATDEGIVPSVDVDNIAGARMATQHLLSLGHTRIAHLMGDANLLSALQRRDSFIETMARATISVPDRYILPGQYLPQSGYERTLQLLSLPEPPTAIFAANDDVARGALMAARERDVAVPAGLSIIGFDDAPQAAFPGPALTSVRQPLGAIGTEAARLLLRQINGEEVARRPYLFPPELKEGDTTAAPGNIH